ncbi:serine hydrolase domain-containing protein [Vallitalea okinawensis]|uniref:serine hydrolase domain-containing protein n=1 Tax=Vallitalea okinawensis TaxID=2078660 RepID=UPI000CFC87AE|nr:serine hydrolase [Vallitalea okinawensis]
MKKYLLRGVLVLITVIIMITGSSMLIYSPEYIMRIICWGESDIRDVNRFPYRELKSDGDIFYFEKALNEDIQHWDFKYTYKEKEEVKNFDDFLSDNGTTGFIIIQNDKILYEEYFNGYQRDSLNTSFSMAKSIDSLLIGCAIDDGYIESEKDSLATYIHEFKGTDFEKLTIEDLLKMNAGIQYEEDKLWLGDDAKTYYMPDLRKLALKETKVVEEPKSKFHYNNYHPLLLGIIIERATNMYVSDYFSKKIWSRIGAEFDASWSIDSQKSGFEKMESGINARTIDFAKLGRLVLNSGMWNNERLISEEWIKKSTVVDVGEDSHDAKGDWLEKYDLNYQYMWYSQTNSIGSIDYFAAGKYGQYLYISPDNGMIIVRNGKSNGEVDSWFEVFKSISDGVTTRTN